MYEYLSHHNAKLVLDPSWAEIKWPKVEKPVLTIDLETCEDDPDRIHAASGHIRLFGFTFDGETVYMLRWQENPEAETIARLVCDTANKYQYQFVFHNASFDMAYLVSLGFFQDASLPKAPLNLSPKYLKDTRLIEQNLYANWYKGFSLANVVARRFDVILDKDVRDAFVGMALADDLTEEQIEYAACDVAYTHRIYLEQRESIPDETKPAILTDMEALWSILQMVAAPISEDLWRRKAEEVEAALAISESQIPVNMRSPKQVREWLAQNGVHTKSTSAKALEKLAKDHQVVAMLLEARKYGKLKSSYGLEWLRRFVRDGLVRPAFNVFGAATSRTSSDNPNLQNIPRGDLRKTFIAPPGMKFVIADYSQQEVWIAAYRAQDERLLDLLRTGDVYTEIGKILYQDPSMTKKDKRRQLAKSAVLGLLYGLTENGMAKNQGISVEEAEKVFDQVRREFPLLWGYIHNTSSARQNSYVTTQLGHRYWLNLFRWNWPNNAANSPVQGTGADMSKKAMYRYTCGRPWELCLMVHDELVALVPDEETQDAASFMEWSMDQAFRECLPGLEPGIKIAKATIGQSWADKE